MRSVLFALIVGGVYMLLRGWPEGWTMSVRIAVAGFVLMAGLLLWCGKKKPESVQFSSRRKPEFLDYVAALIAVVLIETIATAALVTVEKTDVFSEISFRKVEQQQAQSGQGDGQGGRLWNDAYERELPKSSDHKLESHPEVYLELLGDGGKERLKDDRVYLRGFTFSHFDGDRWKAGSRVKKVLRSDAVITFSEIDPERPVYRQRVTYKLQQDGQNLLLAMPGIRNVEVEHLAQVTQGIFLLPVSGTKVYGYTVESQPLDDRQLAEAGKLYEVGEAGDDYLELPSRFKDAQGIRDLLRDVPDDASLLERLAFVRDLLNKRCSYSLKVENSAGVGSMENFLFEEKVGYCEHFSSAAAILCRKMGIPSRVAYGYSGGVFYPQPGMRVFRSRDAHAWTEVYVKGLGWVVFDTTPSAETAVQSVAGTAAVPSLDFEEKKPEAVAEEGGAKGDERWWFVAAVAGLLASALVVSLWKSRQSELRAITEHGQAAAPYMLAFQRICQQLDVREVEAKTVRELVAILQKTEKAEDFLNDLADYHNGVVYQAREKDESLEREFMKKLGEWVESRGG